MIEINAYWSGWVRGPDGDRAEYEGTEANIKRNIIRCNLVRELTDWEIWCPHEWEDVLSYGWLEKEEDLFKMDLGQRIVKSERIVRLCCAMVPAFNIFILGDNPDQSRGVTRELASCSKHTLIFEAWKFFDTYDIDDYDLGMRIKQEADLIEEAYRRNLIKALEI